MSCVQIRMFAPSNVPPMHRDGDTFVFDTSRDFDLRLSKFLEELTDFNKIRVDGVLGFDLESTEKNDIVLKKYIDPHNYTARQNPIVVQVFSNSLHYLRFHDLYIIGFENKKYKCELKTGSEHWVIAVKDLTLNKIVLHEDPVVYTESTVTSNNLDDEYINGENGIRWPMVNYGKFSQENNGIQLQDFRPFVSILWVIQKAFCQKGWSFRSPILESNYGRRLIMYALDKDFGNDPSKINTLNVIAQRDSVYNIPISNGINPLQFTFSKIIQNDGNFWSWPTGNYTGAGIFDIEAKILVRTEKLVVTVGRRTFTLRLKMMMETYNGTIITLSDDEVKFKFEFWAHQNRFHVLSVSAQDVQNDIGGRIFFEFSWDTIMDNDNYRIQILDKTTFDDGSTIGDSLLTIVTKQAFLQDWHEFKIQDLLRKDKFTEFLKGVAHLFRGKFETNFKLNTVTMYPSYDVKIWEDEFIEGYFKTDLTLDVSKSVQFDSEKISNPNSNLKRYTKIKFKNGDAAIQELVLKKLNKETGTENDYLSYTIDNGSQYENETETLENPYYEPTYNGLVNGLDPSNGTPVNMPFMMSNYDIENPKASYDINPRILYWAGRSSQRHKTLLFASDGMSFIQIKIFDNPLAFNLPCSWQDSGDQEFSRFIGGSGLNPSYPLKSIRTQNVAYGTRLDKKDLYHYFYQRYNIDLKINSSIGLLLFLSNSEYHKYSFRDLYTFNIIGRTVIGRLISIDDFSVCYSISTPVTFMPITNAIDSCSIILDNGNPTDLFCRGNAPTLEVNKDGSCYNFGIGGTNVSPITSIQYQYKYFGTTTWVTASSLCDPENGFDVRAIIDYDDDCPTISRYRSVNACGNLPELSASFNYEDNCFSIEVLGTFVSPSHSSLIEYSFDGTTWNLYTEGNCEDIEEDTTEIFIRATVSYSDGCPDDELEIELDIPPGEVDCTSITADVECTNEGSFTRIGTTVRAEALDIIQYRQIGETVWKIWDEINPVTPCPFEYRRVVFYCNDACPVHCSPIRECNCDCNEVFEIICIEKVLTVVGAISLCEITWSGPSGFTASGNNVLITLEGTYTASIECDGCSYEKDYIFTAPNAGSGSDVTLDQDGNIVL